MYILTKYVIIFTTEVKIDVQCVSYKDYKPVMYF
jgi:hypothetical protein